MIAAERTGELALFLVWHVDADKSTARVYRAADHRAAAERAVRDATVLVCRCGQLPWTYTVVGGHAELGVPARAAVAPCERARDSARMAVASADRALAMIGGR